jgi:GntR family transcriptional regulator
MAVTAEPRLTITSLGDRPADAVRRLRDLLRVEITEGTVPRPLIEADLQRTYRTTRGVVRAALDLLRAEGLIERVPGAGTFAVSRIDRHHFDRLQGLSQGVHDGGRRVRHCILVADRRPAPAVVARALGIEAGRPVVLLERRTAIDGEPVSLGTHWLPTPDFDELPVDAFLQELYDVYEAVLGCPVGAADSVIEAVAADGGLPALLAVPAGTPLLRFQRTVRMADGRPAEFGVVRCRGDRISLISSVRRLTAPIPEAMP